MASEQIPAAQQHLDTITTRTELLTVQLHDKRDAALILRRNADAKDVEADGVRAELAMLNEARLLIGKGLGL